VRFADEEVTISKDEEVAQIAGRLTHAKDSRAQIFNTPVRRTVVIEKKLDLCVHVAFNGRLVRVGDGGCCWLIRL